MRSEKITVRHQKGVGIVAKGYMSDEHLAEAIAKLKAEELKRRNQRKRKNKPFAKLRKFFRCLYKTMQPTPRVQHVVCRQPLMIEATYTK